MNFQYLVNELRAEGMPLYFDICPERTNIFIDKHEEKYEEAFISLNDRTKEVEMNLPNDLTAEQAKIIKKFVVQNNFDDMLTNTTYEYFLTLGNHDDNNNICYIKHDGDKFAFVVHPGDKNPNDLPSEYVFTDMKEIKKIINAVNINVILKGDE